MTESTTVPIGTIIMWPGLNDYPTGWLLCDGGAHAQEDYGDLYQTIGHTFGEPATPATHFHVPDLRGMFVRGVDLTPDGSRDPDRAKRTNWAGKTVGGVVGSVQEDELASHTHSYTHFPDSRGDIASGDYWQAGDGLTGATGGAETRPKNVYLNFLIHAK